MPISDRKMETEQSRYAFQHFDQETDFGVENENGERVRKKKRPGRKPNPPSIQQKRAQNRAAQKAFREREQQKNKEKEQQRTEEIKNLKRQLAIAQYEAKYLKACVLHLTLASLIYRGSIPHFWTESRIMPNTPYDRDELYQKPAHLDMFLDNQSIIDLDQALRKSTQYNNYIQFKERTGSDLSFQKFQDFVVQETLSLNKESQDPSRCLPKYKKRPPSPSLTPELRTPPPAPDSPPLAKEYTSPPLSIMTDEDHGVKEDTIMENEPATIDIPKPQALTIQSQPLKGTILEPPSFKNVSDLSNLPPLQALHILRLQLKISSILGEVTSAALLPTALQRIIPHDVRIDYVPGPAIRDRMILFQDLYNMDECFNFLTETGLFIGGDVRNARNWLNSPEYSRKFWFLSHQLVDENIDDRLPRFELSNILKMCTNSQDVEAMNEDQTNNTSSL